MQEPRTRRLPVRIAVEGTSGIHKVIYSTVLAIDFPVHDRVEVARWSPDTVDGYFQVFGGGGRLYAPSPGKQLDAVELAGILDWTTQPDGGSYRHPLARLWSDVHGFGWKEFDSFCSDNFSPPDWVAGNDGKTHGTLSFLYGGHPSAGWQKVFPTKLTEAVASQGRPRTLEEHAEVGLAVSPGPEAEIGLAIQEMVSRNLALVGDTLMTLAVEPSLVVTVIKERKSHDTMIDAYPEGRFTYGGYSLLRYPLHRGDEAMAVARSIGSRLSGAVSGNPAWKVLRPDLLSDGFRASDWKGIASIFHEIACGAAPYVNDAALLASSDMNSIARRGAGSVEEWLACWTCFDDAIGDMADRYAGFPVVMRKLHIVNEFVRFGFMNGRLPSTTYRSPPLLVGEARVELLSKLARYLHHGGKTFEKGWFALRASGDAFGDVAQTLVENPPIAFANPGALQAWNGRLIPELMALAGMGGERPKADGKVIGKGNGNYGPPRGFPPAIATAVVPKDLAEEFGLAEIAELFEACNDRLRSAARPTIPNHLVPSGANGVEYLARIMRSTMEPRQAHGPTGELTSGPAPQRDLPVDMEAQIRETMSGLFAEYGAAGWSPEQIADVVEDMLDEILDTRDHLPRHL